MMLLFERTAKDECLSDLAFDRLLAEEGDAEGRARAAAHIDGCARCKGRFSALELERANFLARGPGLSDGTACPERAPRSQRRSQVWRRGARRLIPLTGALAAVVTLMVWLRPGQDAIRTKGGGVELGFYVKHKDRVRRGAENEVVAPGDALRFTYSSASPRFLAILSVDPTARVSVYYPAKGESGALEEPGRDVALPLSTVLDETIGQETIFGVFCEQPIVLAPLELLLLERPARLDPPKGCTVVQVPIEKRKLE